MDRQTEVHAAARGRVMAMDSAYDVSQSNRDRDVVVNASYCGVLPARFIAAQRPRGAIGIDCAVGPAGASIAGLWYLEALNIPAATADVMGVRLGDGVDLFAQGCISFANRPALDCGVRVGMSVREAARALLAGCEQEARGLGAALRKFQDLRFEADADLSVAVETLEWAGAMSNLVANAIRYTPNGGSIDVRWRVVYGGRSEFSVRDTGEGIAPEHVPRLTERFYRVDRSRSRETGGTGLGLAIVKHVAQRHGGELRIDSVVGVGSTFTLCLPASRVRAEVSAPVVDASTPTPAA